MSALPLLIVLLLTFAAPAVGSAQDRAPVQDPVSRGGWNSPRALAMVGRARAIRQASVTDSSLTSYRARADGYVYFFLDRTDEDEHSLIKADQLALDVYWQAPGLTRQRIVGRRDEKVLPTNINYHLDHLTVVQDDFSDLIRIGDGDEVAAKVDVRKLLLIR